MRYVISGSGSVTIDGPGTVTFTRNETYIGATIVSAGTLQVGNGGTPGNLAGAVVDNGILEFLESGSPTLAGNLSGSGQLVQAGSGDVTLGGTDSFNGTITVNAGGELDVGSTLTLNGTIVDNGTLAVDGGNTLRLHPRTRKRQPCT